MRNRNRKNYRNNETQSTDEVLSSEANNLIEKNYPFSGRLIDGLQASNWLIESLSKTDQACDLCSAFLRSDVLLALMPKDRTHFQGRVLVRWQFGDLQSGVSDLDSYLTANKLGFKFFIRQDFHGKVFFIPDIGAVVGSANATLSGFGMKESANSEVCTLVPTDKSNTVFIDDLFNGAIEINDQLFQEISNAIKSIPLKFKDYAAWPAELFNKLQSQQIASNFFTSECLVSVPEFDGNLFWYVKNERDRKLLGLHDEAVSRPTIISVFNKLKVHRWLVEILMRAKGELYFGSLTSSLHDALLDDPNAYRKDVKMILQTILSWYELFPEIGITVDRPNHSQRIRIS